MWMFQRLHIYIYADTYFLYVYMCAKVYEDCYVYNVCRFVHIFLYMLNILYWIRDNGVALIRYQVIIWPNIGLLATEP